MSYRQYIERLSQENRLVKVTKPISTAYEISGVLKRMEPAPLLFESVKESEFRVAGNLFCTKASFADYFAMGMAEILPALVHAIEQPSACRVVDTAPCQEVVELYPDLNWLPILRHCLGDGGPYISAGIVIAAHPVYGQNVDFHRAMQLSSTEMAVRVVQSRHFDAYLKELNAVDVAICVGNSPNVLAAAATSVALGVNELEIANTLEPLDVVKAKTLDVFVPAETEFVIEGTVYLDRLHAEGPFVDLTETQDVVRQQPIFKVKAITHRKDAIWQALLPGALEHKLLMGMPREPTIYKKVSQVVHCLDVNINPGGCSWLHAIVKIDKQAEDDGKNAILAAFEGHRSAKHVYVVDRDIDIYNPLEVEWAMATRFQADRDLVILDRAPGSSLDPSADAGTHITTRAGFDLTHPLDTHGKLFTRAPFPDVDLEKFIDRE